MYLLKLLWQIILHHHSLLFALHQELEDSEGNGLILHSHEDDSDEEVHALRVSKLGVNFGEGNTDIVDRIFTAL